MSILQEMLDILTRVFGNADTITLIIMLVVVVASGLMLRELRGIISVTVGALAITGLLSLAYTVTQGADPAALPGTAWTKLRDMQVGDLVVYFLAFAIVISAIHLIRNMVQRG